MQVVSTRDAECRRSAEQAVLEGIAPDGGLFVPELFPSLDLTAAYNKANAGYQQLCAYILGMYFDLDGQTLIRIAEGAYAEFSDPHVVPLHKLDGRTAMMELYHGPTLAFKDLALQALPRLMKAALAKTGQKENVLILTATSGDTGKAAMAGFADVERTAIQVFYPEYGVSAMQKLQMATQEGVNVAVCAVNGNFDDAQTGVKQMFEDRTLRDAVRKAGYSFSSANSINFGRLIPQVAYYVYTYAKLVADGTIKAGDKLNFSVPTGNFGNILAAYYAMKMGLPVGKLICASNSNNVLTEFFESGVYDKNRTFFKTMSPSMDILISSNLERLLFELCERDSKQVRVWMDDLSDKGSYRLPDPLREEVRKTFYADFCTEEDTREAIRNIYAQYDYLMDPHTAVAVQVLGKYRRATGDDTPCAAVSTANPYKFPQDVLFSVNGERTDDAFNAAQRLSECTHTSIPPQISELKTKPVLHNHAVEKDGMLSAVQGFLDRLRKE